MTYEEVLNYIEHTKTRGFVLGLSNMEQALALFGNPERDLSFIHVTGTNGKGSVCKLVYETLKESGYRTGLYTSPGLRDFGERMIVDDDQISKEQVAELGSEIVEVTGKARIPITEFEFVTLMAILHFHRERVEAVVFEVGMGGRLDATNIIDKAEISIITSIGLDHTDYLGNDLVAIASEKAGIIKEGCDVVLYPQGQEVSEVIKRSAQKTRAAFYQPNVESIYLRDMSSDGMVFDYGGYKNIRIGLIGLNQIYNGVTALMAVERLKERGWRIEEADWRKGFEKARNDGRFEVIQQFPTFIVDSAHNPQGVASMVQNQVLLFPRQKVIYVVGFLADKDYNQMIDQTLMHASEYVVLSPDNSRRLEASVLAEMISDKGIESKAFSDVETAILYLRDRVKVTDVVVCYGSFFHTIAFRDAIVHNPIAPR